MRGFTLKNTDHLISEATRQARPISRFFVQNHEGYAVLFMLPYSREQDLSGESTKGQVTAPPHTLPL